MGAVLGPRRAEGRTATRVRLTRAGVAIAAAVALLFAYYAWTATSSGNPFNKVEPFNFSYDGADYYNLQADAFLHGRLWVDVPFDPQLLTAENPYALDPGSVSGLYDGSFYDGRYYLTWGPAPAVTTFLPARLVGLRIQENLVITLYCFFGVVFAAMTLTLLVRRLVPGTSRAVLWTGNATMALATAIPWILRRPSVYEVAISGAFFFMMAGLLVLVRELLREEPPRRVRLAAAGTLLGLGVLSRPTMVFVVLGVMALAWILRPDARRTVVPLIVGIPVIAGVIFMAYNIARFSGPLDFGNKYQTAGNDIRDFPFNDLANLPPALFGYLVAPLHPTVGFPYIHLPPPPDAPFASDARYRAEPTASVLWAMPFALLAFAFVARRRRVASGDDSPRVKPVVVLMLTTAALVLVSGCYAVPGYTERYELDFLPWLVMAATLGWAALIQHASTPRRAAAWRRGGIALAAWGILVGVAIGFTGYYDGLNLFSRDRFKSLERAFSPLPTLATKIAGRPMLSGIRISLFSATSAGRYTTLDIPPADLSLASGQTMEVTIVSPDARDADLMFEIGATTPGSFTIHQSGAGQTTALVHDGNKGTLPLQLKRGVNYADVTLTPGADTGGTVQAEVNNLRLR